MGGHAMTPSPQLLPCRRQHGGAERAAATSTMRAPERTYEVDVRFGGSAGLAGA